ncbi:carbonate dehydratase [Desmophyllum pertusum]|uniref:Carbonic anhydrase n=1 Tax=Desmophyllum pertusum TaxID=174260 RepID=A0A9X0D662_9CNID|nr:carbonate dehydratase [Desmophyllum pertusum]
MTQPLTRAWARSCSKIMTRHRPTVPLLLKTTATRLQFFFPEGVYSVSGGGLVGNYSTTHFHLHWGSVNTQGSEHNLDGKKFAAEMHFVSYNTKYSSISEAVSHPDGLAVLGVLIKVEGDNNAAFSFLEDAKNLINKSSSRAVQAFKLQAMLPSDQTKYFRYSGSLTTPGCQESVTWTVFNEAVKISQDQINILHELKANANTSMSNNYRPCSHSTAESSRLASSPYAKFVRASSKYNKPWQRCKRCQHGRWPVLVDVVCCLYRALNVLNHACTVELITKLHFFSIALLA